MEAAAAADIMDLASSTPKTRSFTPSRGEAQPRSLRPARVLVQAHWWLALAVLVLNDHALKGSGLLPGALTGKLSDVAGLWVAPVLLATVVRVRSERALAACFALVGGVFAGIQLSPTVVELWSGLMAWLGFPWSITMDPSDLFALLVLPAAWRVQGAAMRQRGSLRGPLRRSLAAAGVGGGLVACMATSPVEPPIEPFYLDVRATTYLHNASDGDLDLLLRPLRSEVVLDCSAVAADPGGLIPDAAFDAGVLWSLPPRTTIATQEAPSGRDCEAVLVSGDSITPFVVYWDADVPERFVPGLILEGEAAPSFGVSLRFSADRYEGAFDTGPQIAYARSGAPDGGECEAPDESARLDWTGLRNGSLTLTEVELGLDGCMRLSFQDEAAPAYLCAPTELFPFVPGDTIAVQSYGAGRSLTLADAEAATGERRELHLIRGGVPTELPAFTFTARTRPSCELRVDPDCPVVQAPAQILAVGAGQSAVLEPSAPAATLPAGPGDPRTLELRFAYAAQRVLLDTSCADGRGDIGPDLELAVLVRP